MAQLISPRTAGRYLRDVGDPGHHFHTADGRNLRNLIDLFHYLKTCDESAFRHHVAHAHNHFSEWVHDEIQDQNLAHNLSMYREKNPMRGVVIKRVNILVHMATREPKMREKAEMILEEAQVPEEVFHSTGGQKIKSLRELNDFLENADDGVFNHHVSHMRNDIHDWVFDVLMDHELAREIARVRDREAMSKRVADRLSYLEYLLNC